MNKQRRGPCDNPNKEVRSASKPDAPKTFDGRARMRGGDVDAPGLTRDPTACIIKTR